MPRPKRADAEQRLAYARAKAQAKYRSEPWAFTYEDWQGLWQGQWHDRGMSIQSLCMIRCNVSLPWSRDNCRIIGRDQYLCNQSEYFYRKRPGHVISLVDTQ